MDRRSTIASLLGRKSPKKSNKNRHTQAGEKVKNSTKKALIVNGLEPYSGSWGTEQAAHLLRRTSFGPNYNQIKDAVSDGLELTLAQILTNDPTAELPVYSDYEEDPLVANGETWVEAIYPNPILEPELRNQVRNNRSSSLVSWQMGLMLEQTISIREKMTLFWHNHYPISNINDPIYVYKYSKLLRDNCLGNFRDLTKEITINGAMLRYLNGRENTKDAPNENYARELLELFSIGKGPIAGPGDYTNYTEDDVREIARVLTGWKDRGYLNFDENAEVFTEYTNWNHDLEPKQLSHRFDNIVIENAAEEEYSILIDIIFAKEECARFISRKLYRWFVHYDITEAVENDIIQPMAQLIIDNDYEMKPALEALLSSAHFFDSDSIGCMIKNPIDYMMTVFKPMQIPIPEVLKKRYEAFRLFYFGTALLQMQYFNPPNVAGWHAYYQGPSYYQLWVNSVSLPLRRNLSFTGIFLGFKLGNAMDDDFEELFVDALGIIDSLDNPAEINPMLDELATLLLPRPLTDNQKQVLKQALIPGLPDFEWNVEYSEYASDPGNVPVATAVRDKVRILLNLITNMPEFQLS